MYRLPAFLFAVIGLGLPAFALSGSSDSPVGALETVPPRLDAIAVPSETSVEAAFSEPMLAPGVAVSGSYTLSGTGAGTLGANPDSVTGSGPYTLTWSSGEMLDGETVTLTVTGVQDAVGNPIDTNANSVSATGAGVAPMFSGLSVAPSQAAVEETVSISFDASEDLDTEPTVTVNGHAATITSSTKATSFTYEYIIAETDPLGPATVAISGFDPAGNLGAMNNTTALSIIVPAAEVPLRAWPTAVSLLLAGLAVLSLRRRKFPFAGGPRGPFFLLLASLLATPAAMGQAPAVFNVTFTQQPTSTGTEVVITYDLDSPNGPSDIAVSLSKDGGSGAFSFPVTTVTGDLSGVTTGTGYTIAWDIAADYPNENIPNAQLRVAADDRIDVPELIPVGAGSFVMGNSETGNDNVPAATQDTELPRHTVSLAAYEIGKFELTNQQVCDVFNWADDQGYFSSISAASAHAYGRPLIGYSGTGADIEYVGGVFQVRSNEGVDAGGAPVSYSMADHPVRNISWYGAAVYCNWLSEILGLTPVYDTSTWEANFANDGYHLPTEAQWERAAAWDGTKHWIYGFTADTLNSYDRANHYRNGAAVNPLGLTEGMPTSPVGWFDGSNISPNGNIATQNSASPIGAYDMAGNLWEWCHDWYDAEYYAVSAASDPEGAASGVNKIARGGSWFHAFRNNRTARRFNYEPEALNNDFGFRVAK